MTWIIFPAGIVLNDRGCGRGGRLLVGATMSLAWAMRVQR